MAYDNDGKKKCEEDVDVEDDKHIHSISNNMAMNFDMFKEKIIIACTSIYECAQIKRVINALKHYQSLNGKEKEDMVIVFCTQIYKHLLDDFNHIILDHNNTDIQLIHSDIISKQYKELILSCEFKTCEYYKRAYRNREQNEETNFECVLWCDIFDQIHSYLLHLFDSGIRMMNNLNINEKETTETYDSKLKSMYAIISEKRIHSNVCSNRFSTKKFNITLDKKDNETKQSDSKQNEDEKTQSHNQSSLFSIGYCFYYWKHYKNKAFLNKQHFANRDDHLGHIESTLFINKKYLSFKEELLNNLQHKISKTTFDNLFFKTKKYINTQYAKQIKAADRNHLLHYEIEKNIPISFNHLMSILCYTDCTDLCNSFSSTFRAISMEESLESIKNRNREYWHFSKLIRETVQYFGDKLNDRKDTNPFYCGISFMFIPSFVIRLNSPTSTSKQLSVAYNFADSKGIVIQINNGSNTESGWLRYFNCSWISSYCDEDERLLCGGYRPLRIESITLVATQQNLFVYCKSMFYFDCMVSGIDLTYEEAQNIDTKTDH
eukprot:113577_1